MRWLLALAALSCSGLAQERPTFKARADLVVVHATVEDRRGAAVPGLDASHFRIYEDNYPQTISLFSTVDAPASIGLLIDNSTSMVAKRERVIASAVHFAELSNPDDEIFVLAFNEHVREAWAPRVIADSDIGTLRATLLQRISARGKTALFDALHVGLDRLRAAEHARQVLVLVSDGGDNASRTGREETLARVRASNAMIYTVMLHDPVDRDGDPRLLKTLAEETGGETFRPRTVDEVPDALAHIARDIRASYTLGYVPTNTARDGAMRHLRVVARHPDGRTLAVRARGGYLAPASPAGSGAHDDD